MKKISAILCLAVSAFLLAAQSVNIPLNNKWKAMPLTRDVKVIPQKSKLEIINNNKNRPYAAVSIKTDVDLTATQQPR